MRGSMGAIRRRRRRPRGSWPQSRAESPLRARQVMTDPDPEQTCTMSAYRVGRMSAIGRQADSRTLPTADPGASAQALDASHQI